MPKILVDLLLIKKEFFVKLATRLRTLTGQRNKVHQGVVRALPYFPFLEKKAALFGLPKEILAIPFLESSGAIWA